MASRQLGKLKQWASEAISSKDRTVVTEEFKELEHDVELRREGLARLTIASEDFHHVLMKKIDSEATNEPDKLLPVDALGVVMIGHGEEFGDQSAYGSSLVRFGRAHCKIATLQEAMGLTFHDTFIEALRKCTDEISDYHTQRKKLESRRLSYDAAISKLESLRKNKKSKDKDVDEAEDEAERAKARYEETAEDVRTRMYAIQENEINQLRDLTSFLDLELNFYQQSFEVLKEVKETWHDIAEISRIQRQRPLGPTHTFTRSVDNVGGNTPRSPKPPSRRSNRDSSEEEEAEENKKRSSRASSFSIGRRSSARKRSDSANTAASGGATEKEDKEKDGSSKRMSVAGWSMSWGSKSGSKAKDKFSSLRGREKGDPNSDDDDDDDARSNKSGGRGGGGRSSMPKLIRSSSTKAGKKAFALYDYAATADDELSFSAGQEIAIVNETSDDWWTGEVGGKTGLFPTSYVRILDASAKRPPAPPRRLSQPSTETSSTSGYAGDSSFTQHTDTDTASELDHPFGDHMLVTHRSPVYGHFPTHEPPSPEHSAAEDGDTDDGEEAPVLSKSSGASAKNNYAGARAPPPMPPRVPSVKKTPPPPPPPRRPSSGAPSFSSTSSSVNLGGTPPLPARRVPPSVSRSSSSVGLPPAISRAAADAASSKSVTASPFDSTTDLTSHR